MRVAGSIDELVAGASARAPLGHTDGKSGSTLERVVVDGEPLVLKMMHPDQDWIARVVGDLCCWPVQVAVSGLLDSLPPEIDHTVVAAVGGLGRNGWGGALLMRDVGPWLVPEGDTVVSLEHHLRFLDHMAALHAAFWGYDDTLLPLGNRYAFFSPAMVELERARGFPQAVPRIVGDGWERFPARSGRTGRQVLELVRDPSPLLEALEGQPRTFIHGDWKMGNLGVSPDDRTLLLDWAYPGSAPPAVDLAWYLAINTRRLPHSKEDAIEAYHAALAARGVDTAGWWQVQLDLALLGGVVMFGWEKALGDDVELGWWLDRAADGLLRL